MRSAIALAALTLAALGFTALAGEDKPTELGKLAAELKPGEWKELKTAGYTMELLTSGRSGIIAYSESMAWDAKSRSLHFIGQGHLSPPPKYVSYWADTNEWKAEPCPDWLAKLMWFHSYDNNSCDPVNGLFFHRPSASRIFWQYDIGGKKWTKLPDAPGDAPAGHGMATAFFPELGAKGSIITFHTGKAHAFDMAGQKWSAVAGDFSKAASYHNVAEYNPKLKTAVFGGGNGSRQLYSLDKDGKATALKEAPGTIAVSASHLAACPASGEWLLYNYRKEEKGFWALDPADEKAEWRKLPDPPAAEGAVATVSTYGVVLLLNYQRIMVYKHAPAGEKK